MTILYIFLQTTSPSSGGFMSFLPFLLIMVVFYFFMIRPQVNRQRAEQKFQEELKKGDKIITAGGIYGKITGVQEKKVIVEISDNIKISIEKNSISREKSLNIPTQNK
tara:strand:- start:12913 stop:13236 length:324 start_codon:yes stop_codon:yes gene_type:complete